MKKLLKTALSLALALVLGVQGAPCALAQEPDAAQDAAEMTIFDPDALEAMTEDFISRYSSYGVRPERFSIAYTYLATGETWFYNPDAWYYSASMYKVPLMMILAEREHNGELTQETDIKGITLAKAEESILVYSNNDYAHLMLSYLGTDQQAREMYKQFSSLPDDYYDPDFVDYSYFTARFMNDVMTTLYTQSERFPHIIDCLKLAQPVDYFHLCIDEPLEIAQKYGSYNEFNHTSGIIYTPNPVILTVMTKNTERAEEVIGEAAKMFVEYTYTLDAKLESYSAEKAAAEEKAAAAKAEEERLAKEAEEQRAAEEERQRAARQEEQLAQQQRQQEEQRAAEARDKLKTAAVISLAAAAAVIVIIAAVKKRGRAKAGRRGGYSPRH